MKTPLSEPLTHDITQYRYLRFPKAKLAGLAFRCSVDYAQFKMEFSVARCNENDNFSRATARQIVDKKFAAGETYIGDYAPHMSLVENAVVALVSFASFNPTHPDTRKAKQIVHTALAISMLKNLVEILEIKRRWGIFSFIPWFWRFTVKKSRHAGLNHMPLEAYRL